MVLNTELAVASSLGNVNLWQYYHQKLSFQSKEVYNPKAFIPHAASHSQAFAHC